MKSEKYIEIRNVLAHIIKGTEWEGHVYLVGGCVRDEIMGQEIHDIDIAVDLPDGGIRFVNWLSRNRLTAKGRRPIIFEHFGTAKVRLRKYPKDVIDCVQTRKERYVFEENPNPEKYFGTIEEDAACRDLTINSLFKNVSTNTLIDPTGKGLHDIENHIIRTPNNPDISLRDNAMHILRCIRFAVKYGWQLDEGLIESMKRNVDIVKEATAYRMKNELRAILALENKERALELIKEVGAMDIVQPFLTFIQSFDKEKKPFKRKRNRLRTKDNGQRSKEIRQRTKGKRQRSKDNGQQNKD